MPEELEEALCEIRSGGEAEAAIDHLDLLRYRLPHQTAELASLLAREVLPALGLQAREHLALHCRSLGVLASSLRLVGRTEEAARMVARLLHQANRAGLVSVEAELLRRSVVVLVDFAAYPVAVQVASQALVLYRSQRDSLGMAKALVDRGISRGLLEDFSGTVRDLSAAWPMLPADEVQYRASVQQWMATVYLRQGRLNQAKEKLDRCLAWVGQEPSYQRAVLQWHRAELSHTEGDLNRALALLLEAQAIFERLNPKDLALVTLDVIQVMVELGRGLESVAMAKGMLALLEPLRSNRGAEGAILTLIRAAFVGRLDALRIDQARRILRRPLAKTPRVGRRI